MLAAAADGVAEGDWLIADRQTAGRGRMARNWASPVGNLYASGLVRLRRDDPSAATLAFVAAIALFDAVSKWAPSIQLKWPNDLLVDGAKLSGILLERTGDAVVVGFGVNLASCPTGLDRPVTSLAVMGITPPEPVVFIETLVESFGVWLDRWRQEGLRPIRAAWLERAHPMGTALIANLPDGLKISGIFDGLAETCALQLRLADGQVRVIHAADVFAV